MPTVLKCITGKDRGKYVYSNSPKTKVSLLLLIREFSTFVLYCLLVPYSPVQGIILQTISLRLES